MVQVRWGCLSIKGNFRENNEDAFVIDPRGRFFIVADGMGGQSAGEKASALATELVPRRLEQTLDFDKATPEEAIRRIDEAVAFANGEIMALSNLDSDYLNMGTTITFMMLVAGKLFVGGVGDSRVYRLRGDQIEQLTKDHSLTQALLDAGTITAEEAKTHRYKNVLYRYLGTKEGGTGAEASVLEAQTGDRFMLCSDGVSDGIKGDLARLTQLLKQDDPQAAAAAIVKAAEDGGSKDNITCVVVHCV
ncbi:MAG TPA: protein phosphatase 2C domain-containing protein [Planctomycetaceae bacterium]|nr:protein phosphatase 2C domain-containing protein [Planctomycetaceae bacterium]